MSGMKATRRGISNARWQGNDYAGESNEDLISRITGLEKIIAELEKRSKYGLVWKEKMKELKGYTEKNKNISGSIITHHNKVWRIAPKDPSKISKDHLHEWDLLDEV